MSAAREPERDQSPREELAQLARALGAQARRAKARGVASTPRKKRANASEKGAAAPKTPALPQKSVETPRAPAAARSVEAATPVQPARASDAVKPGETVKTLVPAPRPASAPLPAAKLPSGAGAAARAAEVAGVSDLPSLSPAAQRVREIALSCASLDELRVAVAACKACGLCKTRTQTVFMDGRGTRRILFVGEAPGADEDRTGVPFVGRAGQLLTDIITKGMGLARDEVSIVNVLKCRPPDNRDPSPAEKELCTPFLDRQIELIDPAVIIPLGRHAAMHVLGIEATMSAMRGKVHERNGRKVVPTFHPAYLLRSPGEKKECWKDIQLAMQVAGLPLKGRSMG